MKKKACERVEDEYVDESKVK